MKSVFLVLFAAAMVACTRSEETSGNFRIQIVAPERKAVAEKLDVGALAFPAGVKVCYGISVSAGDLPDSGNSCSGSLGLRSGFVGEGGTLSVEVPRGDGRTISLFAFLTEPAASCPSWDGAFHGNTGNYLKTFKVGSATGVSTQNDVTVEITASFDGQQSSVASQIGSSCPSAAGGSLKALLYHDGTVINPMLPETPSFYKPALDSLIQLIAGVFSSGGFVQVGNSGTSLNSTGLDLQLPQLHSFAKKPDTGVLFALTSDNKIVQVTGSSTFEWPSQCPFDVPGCALPPWVQSMSPGTGTDMFALDHAGTVYKSTATELVVTGTTVLPIVRQITYY